MKNETVERSFLQGLHVSHVHEHRAIERVATWKKRGGELYTHRSIVFARGEEAGDFRVVGFVCLCVCVLWPAFPRKRAQLDQKFRILSLYGEQASRGLEKPAEKVGRELYLWSFSLSLSLSRHLADVRRRVKLSRSPCPCRDRIESTRGTSTIGSRRSFTRRETIP